jgi:hypothetical protein
MGENAGKQAGSKCKQQNSPGLLRMPLSMRLKKFREGLPPSKRYERQLKEAEMAFFRAVETRPDVACPNSQYRKILAILEEGMAQEGLFAHFEPMEKTMLCGDMFYAREVCGCHVAFVANTQEYEHAGAHAPNVHRIRALGRYFPPVPPMPEHISIFTGCLENGLECAISLASGTPIGQPDAQALTEEGASRFVESRCRKLEEAGVGLPERLKAFCYLMCKLEAGSTGMDALFDNVVFDTLMHELGHLFLRRNSPARRYRRGSEELFADSFAMSAARAPRPYIANLLLGACCSLEAGMGEYWSRDNLFFGRLNALLGIRGFSIPSLLAAVPGYLSLSQERASEISGEILSGICREVGISISNLPDIAREDAEKAVFG